MTILGLITTLAPGFEPSGEKRQNVDGRSHCIHLICQCVSGFVRQIHCTLATYVLKAPQVYRTGNERCRRGTGHGGRSRVAGREGAIAAAFLKRLVVVAIFAPGVLVLHTTFSGKDVVGIGCVGGGWGGVRDGGNISVSSCDLGQSGVHRRACLLGESNTCNQLLLYRRYSDIRPGGARKMTPHTPAYALLGRLRNLFHMIIPPLKQHQGCTRLD